jgi:O-glycosyl hydrolase
VESTCFYEGHLLNGGRLLPEFYQAWANYYVKFIDSYQKKGFLFGINGSK